MYRGIRGKNRALLTPSGEGIYIPGQMELPLPEGGLGLEHLDAHGYRLKVDRGATLHALRVH